MPEQDVESLRNSLLQNGLKPVSLVHPGVVLANLAEIFATTLDQEGDAGILHADVNTSLLMLRVQGQTALIRQLKEGLAAVHRSVMQSYGLDEETAVKLFNSGSFDVSSQSSPFMASWVHQVELSLDFIERRMGGRIRKLFLSGSSLGVNILRPVFELELKRKVEVLPEPASFQPPTPPAKLAEGQKAVSPFLLGACEAWRVFQAAGGPPDAI
jgi:Tfp pilus assembly PilM family ATPase